MPLVRLMRRSLLLSAVAATFLPSPAGAETPTFHVVGYLPDYRLPAFKPDAARYLTDLIYFSAKLSPAGELNLRDLQSEGLKKLQGIKADRRVALFLSVGGWERSEGFAHVAASEALRERFVVNAVKFCREKRFDGLDLDWEHPADEAQQQDYGALLAALKKGFEPHGLRLTVAIADWQVLPAEAIRAVDRVHLMAYDAPGRHSTYEYATSAVERLIRGGVPPEKICLGVPFYGRQIDDHAKSQTYAEIVRRHQPAPNADEVEGVYFNGLETIGKKTRFAIAKRLGGIMIWEVGQDTRDKNSLLRAIHRAVTERP